MADWFHVPYEPTDAMLDAAFNATARDNSGDVYKLFREAWKVMVWFAPLPPSSPSGANEEKAVSDGI